MHNSEPARHQSQNPNHKFKWSIVCSEQTIFRQKIIEELLIVCEKPTLNKQVHCFIAKRFPSGVT